jgi:TolB protein
MQTKSGILLVSGIALSMLGGCGGGPAGRHEFRLERLASDVQGGGDSAISPDGTRFLTSLRRSGNWDIWVYDIPSRKWTQLTSDATDEFEAKWSPDSKSIVFTSTKRGNKDIFLMNLASGRTISLTDDPEDDEYPGFSPDGRSVVFTGGPWMQRRYFLVDIDGRNRRAVSEPSQAGACSFHPSGLSLVCHNYDSGTGNVYVYPLGGGDRLRITSGGFWDYKPTVSPTGQWMAFSRSEEGPSGIWLMPYPAGRAMPLTTSQSDDRWPTWSADGDRLLFHRLVDRGRAIQVFNRRTMAVKTLVGGDENPGPASLDPAGRRIVYAWRGEQGERLRIRDLVNGQITDVSTPGDASFPRWSPDARHIAFALKQGARWEVATFDSVTGEVHTWTHGEARSIRSTLDWSPDGRSIVFHASTAPFEANLYLADTVSGKVTNLTQDHWYSESPAFTSDGSGITFMSTRGGNWTWGFFELSLASHKFRVLLGPDYTEKNYPRLNRAGDLLWSEFSPDGREYLATKDREGVQALSREAGSWARWPSFSANGEDILFTAIDHSVEYWLADGLNGPTSPLRNGGGSPPVEAVAGADISPAACQRIEVAEPNRSQRRASPVQMHHR